MQVAYCIKPFDNEEEEEGCVWEFPYVYEVMIIRCVRFSDVCVWPGQGTLHHVLHFVSALVEIYLYGSSSMCAKPSIVGEILLKIVTKLQELQ